MNNLPLFFTFFLTLYTTAHFLIFRTYPTSLRPEASSCLISLAHGTPAVILSLLSLPYPTLTPAFASPNTPSQNTVLEYSIAYFLMDIIHYLIFNPTDLLFIGHHLATLFVFLTCRFHVFHGAYEVLILLILAEVTSFLQNVWTMARALRKESKGAARVYEMILVPFYAFYSVVRGLLGPVFVVKMVGFYIGGGGDGVVPRWVWVSWICVVVAAISVSILWIWTRWVELYRERVVVSEEKKVR